MIPISYYMLIKNNQFNCFIMQKKTIDICMCKFTVFEIYRAIDP